MTNHDDDPMKKFQASKDEVDAILRSLGVDPANAPKPPYEDLDLVGPGRMDLLAACLMTDSGRREMLSSIGAVMFIVRGCAKALAERMNYDPEDTSTKIDLVLILGLQALMLSAVSKDLSMQKFQRDLQDKILDQFLVIFNKAHEAS